jgi:hypothetical protein
VLARRRAAPWSVPTLRLFVLGASATAGVVVPLATGPAWATPRALAGDLIRGGCPYLDTVDVSDPRTAVPLEAVPTDDGPDEAPVALPEGFERAHVVSSWGASSTAGRRASPWFDAGPATDEADLVIAVAGTTGPDLTLTVEWAAAGTGDVVRSDAVEVVPTLLNYSAPPPWRLVRIRTAGVETETAARRVRLVVHDGAADADLAVAGPVAIVPRSLASLLEDRTALVSPPELPLMRCPQEPRVVGGVAEMPDIVIGFEYRGGVDEIRELDSDTSPWRHAGDAYDLRTLHAWLTDDATFAVSVRDDGGLPAE